MSTVRTRVSSTASSPGRSEEHTSELQSRLHLVCRLLLEKKRHLRFGVAFVAATLVFVLRPAASVQMLLLRPYPLSEPALSPTSPTAHRSARQEQSNSPPR